MACPLFNGGKAATEYSQDVEQIMHAYKKVTLCYQISVDEPIQLQVLHALTDVQADAQHGPQSEAAPSLPEEV